MTTTLATLLWASFFTPGIPAQQTTDAPARPAIHSRVPVDVSVQGFGDPDVTGGSADASGTQPTIDAVTRLACLQTIRDVATGGCLTASSTPMLGALYPLSPAFNIDPAGNIRMGPASLIKAGKLFLHTRGGSGNTGVGNDALGSVMAGGDRNTALGNEALKLNTTGYNNTASGSEALYSNATGAGNTASGAYALRSNTYGNANTASGASALRYNTTGDFNTASGVFALRDNTTGGNNTAVGVSALFSNTTGSDNTGIGVGVLNSNTTGYGNTATGVNALRANTFGNDNTAAGDSALYNNTSGQRNVAMGSQALYSNTNGFRNTAVGDSGLRANTSGDRNVAVGQSALLNNTSGDKNVAIGGRALEDNVTGTHNIAVGYVAGSLVTGSSNIMIGSSGSASDGSTIRIGDPFVHTSAFLAGVRGVTTARADAVNVLVDSLGQLGTVSSARRFKDDIRDMGEATERLLDLRPVVFRYKTHKESFGEDAPLEYGLIADEVADVFPDLVVYDEQGRPETIKYRLLGSMLLNELKRLKVEGDAQIAELRAANEELRERIEHLEASARPGR